jgi:hypothetical protein
METLAPLDQFFPTCKVCERGQLLPKKSFRMSGPVVAIGFILLIPSVLGMVAAGLIFLGVIALNGNGPSSTANDAIEPIREDWDTQYRRNCINNPQADTTAPMKQRVQVCECTLTEYKKSNSVEYAGQVCAQRLQAGTLGAVDRDTKRLYDNLIGTSSPDGGAVERVQMQRKGVSPLFNIIGSTFAIVLGISSFVGGLLGWLLTMKKRVLQCSVCGATVSAS